MLLRHLTAFYLFLAIALSAPILTIYPEETSSSTTTTPTPPTNNDSRPNITLPESFRHRINYETLGGGFEGDMIFPKGFNPSEPPRGRGVAIFGPHRWPNNTIPYDMSAIISTADQDLILDAIQTLMYAVGTPIEGQTSRQNCIYFRPSLPDERNFVKVTYGHGCSGTVGYWPDAKMTLRLAYPGCFGSGTIQHELVHILGFYHEQSRPDRDLYITINRKNIEPDEEDDFNKYEWGKDVVNQNTSYDYDSIMHYDAYAFSSNGKPTISAKKNNVTLGQREKLSAIDIAEIRSYYGC